MAISPLHSFLKHRSLFLILTLLMTLLPILRNSSHWKRISDPQYYINLRDQMCTNILFPFWPLPELTSLWLPSKPAFLIEYQILPFFPTEMHHSNSFSARCLSQPINIHLLPLKRKTVSWIYFLLLPTGTILSLSVPELIKEMIYTPIPFYPVSTKCVAIRLFLPCHTSLSPCGHWRLSHW